jgi:hypothetical protein
MTLLLRAGLSVLSSFSLFLVALVAPVEDGPVAPDLGVVHADDTEAWVDVGADLATTWAITLDALAERGHAVDPEMSYVESNGQIAIGGLWVAVVPRASLAGPVTRVRMVAVDADDSVADRNERLVSAGVLLGVIAERVASASPAPAPAPAPAAPPAVATTGAVYDTYDTYNTYNTYTYGSAALAAPVYVYPKYAWTPWWWLGYGPGCGWSSWYLSYGWKSGWSWGLNWGWGGPYWCNPWWPSSFWKTCWAPSWSCGPSWCAGPSWCTGGCGTTVVVSTTIHNDDTVVVDGRTVVADRGGGTTEVRPGAGLDLRAGSPAASDPGLRPRSGGATRDGLARGLAEDGPSIGVNGRGAPSDRVVPVDRGSSRPAATGARRASDGLGPGAVAALPLIRSDDLQRGRDHRDTTSSGRSSLARAIVVTRGSTASSSSARPGSVTRLKGLSLTPVQGAIHELGSRSSPGGRLDVRSSPTTTSILHGDRSRSPFALGSRSSSPAPSVPTPSAATQAASPFSLRSSPSRVSSRSPAPVFQAPTHSTPSSVSIPRSAPAPALRSMPSPPRAPSMPSLPSRSSLGSSRSPAPAPAASARSSSSGQSSSSRSSGRGPR